MRWAAAVGIALGGAGCDGGMCDAYLNEEATTVVIRFKNERAETIFVGSQASCADPPPFDILNAGGQVLDIDGSGCGSSCESMQSQGILTCPAICQSPSVFMIAPGGQFETNWDGTMNKKVTMPGSCVEGVAGDTQTCTQRVEVPKSVYLVSASAFMQATGCGPNGASCSCALSPSGSCKVDGFAEVGGTPMVATATLKYPDATTVELVWK
jgi:hypothetical protein